MMRNEHHVVPSAKGGWDIVKAGTTSKSNYHFDLKKDAVDKARELSSKAKSELVIHNKNGRISIKNSHGNDPRSIKG